MKDWSRRGVIASGTAQLAAYSMARSARAQEQPVRIGLTIPLSGGAKFFGDAIKLGAEIAADEVNAAGGVLGRRVELVVRDDKASAAEAANAVRELTGMGIQYVAGAVFTPLALAVLPLLPDAKALFQSVAATGLALTHEAYNPYYFRSSPSAYMMYRSQARRAAERNPEITTWGVIAFESAGSLDVVSYLTSGTKDYYNSIAGKNVTVLDPILLQPDQTDFKPALLKLMASGAEGLLNGVTGGGAISLYAQGNALGWQSRIKMIQDSGLEVSIGQALGRRTPSNINSTVMWYHGAHADEPSNKRLYAEVVRRTGESAPSGYVERGYTPVLTFFEAIAAARTTDTAAVAKAMETMEFTSPKGRFRFRQEDHQYLGEVGCIRLDPTQDAPGWKISDYFAVPGSSIVEPPSPGRPFRP